MRLLPKTENSLSTSNDSDKGKGKGQSKRHPNQLTKVGQMMAKMPIDPRLARMLIAGEQYGCLKELLVIVSGLSVQDPRERRAISKPKPIKNTHYFAKPTAIFYFISAFGRQFMGLYLKAVDLKAMDLKAVVLTIKKCNAR